ncbi:hypothetical protein D3C71_21770 [compost metagenome]
MKLNSGNSNSVIASSGAGMTSTFGIANNAHMFNILSSGLYSDKVAAVLREVGCNAMDAHIAGGEPDKPFQVKMPTALDRSFYIKDWGPGLDDDEIKSIYTIYGVSTKQQCEDQTGGFGLGSKSPFAYTLFDAENPDGFTIVSAKNGVKRVYVAHLNDEGAPAVTELGVHPADADWPHGVMVTFPVQNRDIPEFLAKAQEIFQWFRVKPEILGLDRPLQEPKFRLEGSFFKLGRDRGSSEDETLPPAVVMANVRYPIEKGRLQDVTPTMEALLQSGIHLFMTNGEVLMTPSRESLQYNDKTRRAIVQRLKEAANEVAMRVRDDVMHPEATKLAWYRKVHTYAQKLPYGIRARFTDFLVAAGVDPDQIKVIRTVLSENVLMLPHFAGDGADGSRVDFLRDADGRYVLDEDTGARKVDPAWRNTGCRVWMYQESEKGIRRQEVIGGHLKANSEKPIPVAISVLGNAAVYYADETNADARMRKAVAESPKGTMLFLVAPCRGVDASFVKPYAERICGEEGIDGLPLAGVSSLPVPSKVAQDKELRRLRKSMTVEERMSAENVAFVKGNTGMLSMTTLGELDSDGEKFYLVRRHSGSVGNRQSGESSYYIRERNLQGVMQALHRVMKGINFDFSGAVIVDTEGAVRRLKLEELGYKPLLPEVVKAIRDKWSELVASIDRTPRVQLAHMYYADDYGVFGVLAHHMLKRTPAWTVIEPQLVGHPLLSALADFVLRANRTGDDKTEPLVDDLKTLGNSLEGSSLPTSELNPLSYYDVKRTFAAAYPTASGLEIQWLMSSLKSDDPKVMEKAATMLAVALSLDPLPGESEGAEDSTHDQDDNTEAPQELAAAA